MSGAQDFYLETQVATATPQKLRLMLIEGAIRQAQLALDAWEARGLAAISAVIRCRAIVTELLNGVRDDGSPLVRQVSAIYTILSKALTEAQLHHDRERVADVLRVLTEERETWQQLCQQLPEAPQPTLLDAQSEEILAPRRVDPGFSTGYGSFNVPSASPMATTGFSLEG